MNELTRQSRQAIQLRYSAAQVVRAGKSQTFMHGIAGLNKSDFSSERLVQLLTGRVPTPRAS